MAFLRRTLVRSIRDAVSSIIHILQLQTRARFAAEVVAGVCEVFQPRQRADTRRNLAGESVIGDVELLEAPHVPHRLRQPAGKSVLADVKHRQPRQHPDLLRQTATQAGVRKDYLVQGSGHFSDSRRQAPLEIIIGQNQNRNRRVSDILRQRELEIVVVDEQSVEFLVEKLVGDFSGELVEPDIEELERREAQDDGGEVTGEEVVADVELVEEAEVAEAFGEGALEAVGVEVEHGQVGQEAEILRQSPDDARMVKVDSGNGGDMPVVGGRGAVDAIVSAHVGAVPVGGEVLRVGGDGVLQSLKGNEGIEESRVWDCGRGRVVGLLMSRV